MAGMDESVDRRHNGKRCIANAASAQGSTHRLLLSARVWHNRGMHSMPRSLVIATLSGLLLILNLAIFTGCGTKEGASGRTPRVPKPYTIDQFMKTVSVSASGISHDNAKMLYTSDETGVPNVYAAPMDGAPAKALTESAETTYAVSWFPADDRFLYQRDNGGNELYHLYVADPTGNVTDLTPGDKHRALFLRWSKDRQQFFVATTERNASFMDIYSYATDGYARVMHFQIPGGYDIVGISPSGQWVVLNKSVTTVDNNLYLAEAGASIAPKLMTPHEGASGFSFESFSPDEKTIYITTDDGGEFRQVVGYGVESGTVSPVLASEWDVMAYYFTENGRYQITVTNEDADTVVKVSEVGSGKNLSIEKAVEGQRLLSIQFSRDETKAILSVGGDRSPRNLVGFDIASGHATPLTRSLNPEIDSDDLVDSSIVRFAASDGLQIPGPLWVPHQASSANKAPALVWVHGGPGGQTRRGYSSSIQYLVNSGYIVFGINNRGSSGYGKTFFAADDQRHGKEPLRDCVEARAFLATLPEVDASRIGIIGGSYGGYMTLAALAFHPDAFDVGVNIFGVSNWLRTLKSIPSWWEAQRQALYAELGDPNTQEDMLREISPLFHAEKITKPLLVLQGANDPRVLQVESDEIVEKVRANDGVVEYIIFEDEGHGFSKKKNQIEAWEAIRKFLDRYLKGDNAAA